MWHRRAWTCARTCVQTCVGTWVETHVETLGQICVYGHAHVHVHVHVHTHVYRCVHRCVHRHSSRHEPETFVCMCAKTCVYVSKDMCVHVYTEMYIDMSRRVDRLCTEMCMDMSTPCCLQKFLANAEAVTSGAQQAQAPQAAGPQLDQSNIGARPPP